MRAPPYNRFTGGSIPRTLKSGLPYEWGLGGMTALINAREDDLDRVLVVRHQAGDAAAFAQLYARHYPRLMRFCRRLVRDSHLAEEIAQDTFLRAYVALDQLEGERRFYPWITVIARRLVIDHVRRDGRVQPRPEIENGSAGAAEDEVVQRFEGDQVLAALDRVRSRHREVIHLRDWEGLTYEAIAARLGLSPTAVPPLLHRARAAVRREYLLVTEGRVAGIFHLGALAALLRRGRDRLAAWAACLPDASVLSAPVAGAVLGFGGLLVAGGGMPAGATAAQPPALEAPAALIAAPAQSAAAPGHQEVFAGSPGGTQDAPGVAAPSEHVVVPDVASVTVNDPERVQQSRDAQRDHPIFLEVGPAGIASDPEEDRRHYEAMADRALD